MTLANVLANNVLPDQTVSEIEELREKAKNVPEPVGPLKRK